MRSNRPGLCSRLGEVNAARGAAKFVQPTDHRDPPLRRDNEHHEPAATGTRDFPANRTLGEGSLIQLLNSIGAYASRGTFLRVP